MTDATCFWCVWYPADSGWVEKSRISHTGGHWNDGGGVGGFYVLNFAPNGLHVHPITHHTLNVKLITARGHHLAFTAHKGSQAGVRKSALTVDAAHRISYVKLLLPLHEANSNFQDCTNHHQHVTSRCAIWGCCQQHHVSPALTNRMNPILSNPLKILMLQHPRSCDSYTAARCGVVLCVYPRVTLPSVLK